MVEELSRVQTPTSAQQVVRFVVFGVGLQGEGLRKIDVKTKLQEQPFLNFALLLERPGKLATREEIQQGLWPDDKALVELKPD